MINANEFGKELDAWLKEKLGQSVVHGKITLDMDVIEFEFDTAKGNQWILKGWHERL